MQIRVASFARLAPCSQANSVVYISSADLPEVARFRLARPSHLPRNLKINFRVSCSAGCNRLFDNTTNVDSVVKWSGAFVHKSHDDRPTPRRETLMSNVSQLMRSPSLRLPRPLPSIVTAQLRRHCSQTRETRVKRLSRMPEIRCRE